MMNRDPSGLKASALGDLSMAKTTSPVRVS
jgi:hypothetical protein